MGQVSAWRVIVPQRHLTFPQKITKTIFFFLEKTNEEIDKHIKYDHIHERSQICAITVATNPLVKVAVFNLGVGTTCGVAWVSNGVT